jgi:type I restriction enzyme M protein
MTRANLDDVVACYRPRDLDGRKPTWSEKKNSEGRWRSFTFEEPRSAEPEGYRELAAR